MSLTRLTSRLEVCRKQAERHLGNEFFVYQGFQIPVISTSFRDGWDVNLGGHWNKVGFSLLIRRSALPEPPAIGEIIEFRGKQCRVNDLRYTPDNTAYRIEIQEL